MSLGDNLKRLRRDKGWTQGDLHDHSNVKVGHISKLERDETDPKLSTIYKLINALDCTPDMLLIDTEKTSMGAILKISFERASGLPDESQRTIIDLIDKYCIATSLQGFLKEGNKTSINLMKGKTKDILPKE